jgi:sRNA-binding protein
MNLAQSETTSSSRKKAQQWVADANATLALLRERFPNCFNGRRPLKIGIHLDILARLGDEIAPRSLARALQYYTRRDAYLQHIVRGAWRYDLDGNPVGDVVPREIEQQAKEKLAKITARRKQRQAPPPPSPQKKRGDGLNALKAAALRRRQATMAEVS